MTRADSDVAGGALRRDAERDADRVARNRGMDQGMSVLSYLIAGVAVWGGLGWLGDHVLQTRFLLPIGIVLGAALGVYVIIKRFGDLGVKPDTSVPPTSREEK